MDSQNNFQMNDGLDSRKGKLDSKIVAVAVIVLLVLGVGSLMLNKNNQEASPVVAVQQGSTITLTDFPGKIAKIEGKKVFVDLEGAKFDSKVSGTQRVFLVSEDTKIYSRTQKSEKTIKEETEAIAKDRANGNTPENVFIMPPSLYAVTEVSLEKLAIGTSVIITAKGEANENGEMNVLVINIENK